MGASTSAPAVGPSFCPSDRPPCHGFRRQISGEPAQEEVATDHGDAPPRKPLPRRRESCVVLGPLKREGSSDSLGSSASVKTIDSNDLNRLFTKNAELEDGEDDAALSPELSMIPRLTSASCAGQLSSGLRGAGPARLTSCGLRGARFNVLATAQEQNSGDEDNDDDAVLDKELDAEEKVLCERKASPFPLDELPKEEAARKEPVSPKSALKSARFASGPEQLPNVRRAAGFAEPSFAELLAEGQKSKEKQLLAPQPKPKAKLMRSKSQQQLLATLERVPSQKLQLIIENPQSIDVNYEVHHDRLLMDSCHGKVCEATVKGTRASRVAKYIEKEANVIRRARRLKVEIMISKLVDHPNLIKLYEIFEDETHIILVKELCTGGTLHSRLTRGLPEMTAAGIIQQLVSGVHYMHASSVCHRNLKPQNIFVASPGLLQNNILKITDFSMACMLEPGQMLTAEVGTTSYKAPQVFMKCYDEKCDVWSLGVILYLLIAGYLPFDGEDREEKVQNIMGGQFVLMESVWSGMSSDVLKILQAMLKKNPQKRLSAGEAWRHPWFEKKIPPKKPAGRLVESSIQQMRSFRGLNKFKKAAFHLIVSMLDEAQIRRPREIFMWLDADKDGVLSEEDLKLRLEPATGVAFGAHPQDSKVHNFYYTEFLAATFDSAHIEDETCRLAFSIFDQDDGGTITINELTDDRSPLGHISEEEIRRLVDEMDDNGDGEIDFPEFLDMMRGKNGKK